MTQFIYHWSMGDDGQNMFVLINGAFGIGKSTVARELRSLLPRSVIFDPEWVGLALQRMPGSKPSDFQDLSSWRRLTVLGARSLIAVKTTIIVPMAFSNHKYLEEVRCGLSKSRRPVLHFCLTAPIEVVRERLNARGEPQGDPEWSWVHRRAAECCAAHQSPAFAKHVPAEKGSPAMIAAELAALVSSSQFMA
jgi:predicted kinase